MDTQTRIRIGKIAETLWLLSRGMYGRDLPPRLLKLAAVASEVLEAVRRDPEAFPETFEGICLDFIKEASLYIDARCREMFNINEKSA